MTNPLHDLQHALARTHRARLARRRTIAACIVTAPALALVVTATLTMRSGPLAPSPLAREGGSLQANREGGHTTSQHPDRKGGTSIASIPTPPPHPLPLGERMSASSPTGEGYPTITIQRMTDDELLAALAEAGQPSGLITINGHTTVVANTFADADEPSPLAPLFQVLEAHP